ncbi:hypothetical protein [Streptomyces sp. BBFR109]|uniref:hypothetical protein n=1 Tax=Streptomyces sp. BBFR109 TaxID=3448172 RepID=UPI003F75B6E2
MGLVGSYEPLEHGLPGGRSGVRGPDREGGADRKLAGVGQVVRAVGQKSSVAFAQCEPNGLGRRPGTEHQAAQASSAEEVQMVQSGRPCLDERVQVLLAGEGCSVWWQRLCRRLGEVVPAGRLASVAQDQARAVGAAGAAAELLIGEQLWPVPAARTVVDQQALVLLAGE